MHLCSRTCHKHCVCSSSFVQVFANNAKSVMGFIALSARSMTILAWYVYTTICTSLILANHRFPQALLIDRSIPPPKKKKLRNGRVKLFSPNSCLHKSLLMEISDTATWIFASNSKWRPKTKMVAKMLLWGIYLYGCHKIRQFDKVAMELPI